MGFFSTVWTWLSRAQLTDGTADAQATPERRVDLAPLSPIGPTDAHSREASFPGFRATALDQLASQAADPSSRLAHIRLALNDAFTPAQPVTERRRFAGRLDILVRLISALEDQRAHVVLYGERGIGKTSLVHVLAGIARDSRYHVAYASCGAGARFQDVFRSVLQDIPMIYAASVDPAATEVTQGANLADLLPKGSFDARQLGDICAGITGTRILIILDEYDRTEDAIFRQHIAELIKNLSDRAARVQLVLAGVAGNLQELVGYIPSIRRNIVGLPVPRLARKEVEALIAIGEREAGLEFAAEAVNWIDQVCHGSPYLARLICHHAALAALDAGRRIIGPEDIRLGLAQIVEDAANRLGPVARAACPDVIQPDTAPALAAIALAAATPDGSFGAAEVGAALAEPLPAKAIASALDHLQTHGLIGRTQEAERTRFRFQDEAMPFYLWMAVAQKRLAAGAAQGSNLRAA